MKVLNLQCAHRHGFEGWFASEDDFRSQLKSGLLACPMCGDTRIQKMLSAPRLNLRAARDKTPALTDTEAGPEREIGPTTEGFPLQAELLRAMRHLLAHSEDVGERFADQARAMHHGDVKPRNIRGRSSRQQALELIDEGIEVMPLPALAALKETLQ